MVGKWIGVFLGGVFPEGVNEFKLHVNVISMLADRVLMQEILDDKVPEVRPHNEILGVRLFLLL